MEVNYTPPTDPKLLDPVALADQLSATLDAAAPWLGRLTPQLAATPLAEGKWSPQLVIGHLTDSATNNLARIVRLQISPEPLPSYDADAWIALQHYAGREWKQVFDLWLALNRHLAWTIRQVPQHSLSNHGTVGGTVVSLGFVIEDYIAHLRHHLDPLQAWVRAQSQG